MSMSERARAVRLSADGREEVADTLAVEEPLEIRVGDGHTVLARVVTMRTPGADLDLALGWLRAEGVVRRPRDVLVARSCADSELTPEQRGNVVVVDLADEAVPRLTGLDRMAAVSSACGVCGSDSIERVRELASVEPAPVTMAAGSDRPPVTMEAGVLLGLVDQLAQAQRLFRRTGGIHGAAATAADGRLLAVREDVGRHNAVDKILGWSLVAEVRPDALVVSSRASFDVVQKAVVGAIPIVVTVSAPSTLAVDLARAAGVTLAGFARDGRATLYCGAERITG